VTGVTGVTASKINNLARHTNENESVTGVTEIAGRGLMLPREPNGNG
jgi:hypothetical protein